MYVKSCNIKTKEGVVNIKEERKLMSGFIVASRTRQDIDLSYYFAEYEFSVIPWSLFNRYGVLIPSKDKSSVFHLIKDLSPASVIIDSEELARGDNKVIVLDAMAIVKNIQIEKSNDIKLCKDFAPEIVNRVQLKSFTFKETRVTFDRYDELSLKSKTRKTEQAVHKSNIKWKKTHLLAIQKLKNFCLPQKQKKNSLFTSVKNSFVNSYIKINSLW